MTLTSSGVGGNIGGPSQPMQREIEATAWTLVNKAALGIMPDTLEVPFSQLGGNVWKYTSDADRPILKPLGYTRTDTSTELKPDDSWKEMMDELEGQLHPELRANLKAEMGKLFNARDRNYCILNNLMTLTAKGMSWLDKARQPQQPQTAQWEHTEHNIAVTGKALRGAVHHSHQQMKAANNFLASAGANLPEHDDVLKYLNEGSGIQEDLNALLEQLQDPGAPPPDKEELAALADDAIALSNSYNRVAHGDRLQMLGPMFEAMAAVAAALSLTPTTPSLFLGLKMATQGIFSGSSLTGLIGGDLETLLKALIGGLNSSLMNKAGIAKQMMLIMTLLGTTSGATTLAALVAEFGIGRFPSESEEDTEEGETFTLELMLELLASTGLLKTIHEIAAQAAGAGEKAQELISEGMELFSLVLMAAAGGKGRSDKTKELLQSLKPHLEGKVEKMERFVLAGIQNGTIESNAARLLDVSLKQGLICIRNDDFDGLVGVCLGALSLTGCSPEAFMEDLADMKAFSLLVRQASSTEAQEQTTSLTGMIRAG